MNESQIKHLEDVIFDDNKYYVNREFESMDVRGLAEIMLSSNPNGRLYAFLLYAGYLTLAKPVENYEWTLRVATREIRKTFQFLYEDINLNLQGDSDLKDNILSADASRMRKSITRIFKSIYTGSSESSSDLYPIKSTALEYFYH